METGCIMMVAARGGARSGERKCKKENERGEHIRKKIREGKENQREERT